jgi:hypothetical protein
MRFVDNVLLSIRTELGLAAYVLEAHRRDQVSSFGDIADGCESRPLCSLLSRPLFPKKKPVELVRKRQPSDRCTHISVVSIRPPLLSATTLPSSSALLCFWVETTNVMGPNANIVQTGLSVHF